MNFRLEGHFMLGSGDALLNKLFPYIGKKYYAKN